MNTIQKLGLTLGSVAIAVGGAFGVTQLSATSANGATQQAAVAQGQMGAPGQSGQQGGPGGQGAPGGQQGAPAELVSAIATAFNLDSSQVETATTTAFSSVQSQNLQPGDEMDSALAKSLASSLNVDETKMKEVLVSTRSTMQAPSGQGAPGAASGTTQTGSGQAGAPAGAASGTTQTGTTTQG